MKKVHSRFAEVLGKFGSNILVFLSKLEERNTLNPLIRWLKLGFLGVLVTLIASCVRRPQPVITCYKPASMLPVVTDVRITPNPTQGADSIKVQAIAQVYRPFEEDNYVTDAWACVGDDTTFLPLKAADGEFSDFLEEIEGHLDISKLDPCTTLVSVKVNTSKDGSVIHFYQLVVSKDTGEE